MGPRSTLRAVFALVVVGAFARASAARADPPTPVDLEIDGESTRARGYAVEGADAIGPTDLLWVGRSYRRYLVVRGSEPLLRYRDDGDRLLQRLSDGRDVLIALRAGEPAPVLSSPAVGPGPPATGPPPGPFGLTPTEIAGLRGLCIDRDSPDLDPLLATIDPTVPVVVDESARSVISRLPRSLRALVVEGGRDDKGFVEPLPVFPTLRLLDLMGSIPLRAADVEAISRATELRWLAIHGTAPDFEMLSRLRNLRVLDLARAVTDAEPDLSFAASLASLRSIRLDRTRVRDLTPLSGLVAIESIRARGAPVLALPTGTLPALRHLDLIDTLVPPDRAAAFRRARPACAVDTSYRDVLIRRAGVVDTVRVRSGGTCHRNESEEKVLATIAAPSEVAEILAAFDFEEGPVSSCMCCGEPTIELVRGGVVVASLGVHHGTSLRWPGGEWGGDAVLRIPSRIRLLTRLTAAGVPDLPAPAAPDPESVARWERRMTRERELLPIDVLHVLRQFDPFSDAAASADVLESAIPLGAFQVDACLRLLSLRGVAWTAARAALERSPASTVLARVEAGLEDAELVRGAGFWLLRRVRPGGETPALADDSVTDRILATALSDPDPDVRLSAIEGLARRGGPIAVRWNRRVLEGFVWSRNADPAAPKVAETAQNRRAAISAALSLRDAPCLPRIRELIAAEDPEHRATLQRELDEAFPTPK